MSTHTLPHTRPHIHLDKPGKAGSLLALTENDIAQIVGITQNYFPPSKAFSQIVRHHLDASDSIRVARADDCIVGFACASLFRHKTPFYRKPIPVIYQRMLYLQPAYIRRNLGMQLQIGVLIDLLGPTWLLRRFGFLCRTLNPAVARKFRYCSASYPKPGMEIPESILHYTKSLEPLLDCKEVDSSLRLVGVLAPYRGQDFSRIWHRYLEGHNAAYNKLLLDAGFQQVDGKILCRGDSILMVAYVKPLSLLRFLFRHHWRRHSGAFLAAHR